MQQSVDADPTAEGEGIADTDSRSESGADTAGIWVTCFAKSTCGWGLC